MTKTGEQIVEGWNGISTLDDTVHKALGGGIPAGFTTDITGERWVPL